MLSNLDKLPTECGWRNVTEEMRTLLAAATDAQLAAELRKPSAHSQQMREAAVREALARIIERKP